MIGISNHNSKLHLICSLHPEKIAEAVMPYVLKIAFPASPLGQAFLATLPVTWKGMKVYQWMPWGELFPVRQLLYNQSVLSSRPAPRDVNSLQSPIKLPTLNEQFVAHNIVFIGVQADVLIWLSLSRSLFAIEKSQVREKAQNSKKKGNS